MSGELAVMEGVSGDIEVRREPAIVLAEAKKAAMALKDVISKKANPVMMNGEQYLEFEDWQTLGKFYGLTVKVVSTAFIDFGGVKGYEARAVVLRSDGAEISSAEAMCLNDEEKWSSRAKYEWVNGAKTKTGETPVPLFQLRSMAQTRACAKAYRNVLAWVVVLAGYKPTPAEEMTGREEEAKQTGKPPVSQPQAKAETEQLKSVVAAIDHITTKSGGTKEKPWTRYTIILANGFVGSTFDKKIAEAAKTAKEMEMEVTIQHKPTEKYGNEIVSLLPQLPTEQGTRQPGDE